MEFMMQILSFLTLLIPIAGIVLIWLIFTTLVGIEEQLKEQNKILRQNKREGEV
jgi:hypothetical protein